MTKIGDNNQLIIISRNDWEAEPPEPALEAQRYQVPLEEVLDTVVLHHSGMRPDYPPQEFQQWFKKFGWDDFAYHYYILGDGTVVEGRPLQYIGGHAGSTKESLAMKDLTKDPDFGSIGIALAGCFDDSCEEKYEFTFEQLASLEALLLYLFGRFPKINATSILLHNEVDEKWSRARGLAPAKLQPTECPGEELEIHLELLRRELMKAKK